MKVTYHSNLEAEEGPGFVFSQIRQALEESDIELTYKYFPILDPKEFDISAAKEIEKCDLFIGGLGGSYRQILKAKKLGAKTLLLRFSTHHVHQQQALQHLYAQYHMQVFPEGVSTALEEYKLSDYFLVLSEYCKYTYAINGISPDQVFVVPPGVDSKKFTFAEPHEDPFRVLFVGTNPIRKGLPYLLKAWEELVAEGLKGELVVRTGIDRIPVKNTTLISQRLSEEELVDLYHRCSLTVLPSLEEGYGVTNLESMACGRPIIMTDVTGVEDAIIDYKEGIPIPPCNVKAIKKAILHFYENPNELARMGKHARETAERYTWDSFRSNVANIIKGLNTK